MLDRALNQIAELLDKVRPAHLAQATPCEAWTVQHLVDHIVAAPTKFAHMLRSEQVDWSAPTPPAGGDPAATFRAHASDLLMAWREQDRAAPSSGLDWECAELAVHTWDLATALDTATDALDPDIAERGLAFMRVSLTPENRSPAFGPEQQAPADADAYQRIAAYAGRRV